MQVWRWGGMEDMLVKMKIISQKFIDKGGGV